MAFGQDLFLHPVKIGEVLVVLDKEKINLIGKKITTIPNNFNIHKTLKKIFENNKKCFNGFNIDWSTAEALAFGSLLEEGYTVGYQVKILVEELLARDILF